MRIYMFITKDAFYVYSLKNGRLASEFIDGNPFLRYSLRTAEADVNNLIEALADKYNLNSTKDVDFTMIENSDPVRNTKVAKALGGQLKAAVKLNDALLTAIDELAKDPGLRINDFGINYDGMSYLVRDGRLNQYSYSLLALTINSKDIAKCLIFDEEGESVG